jgi:hypothetical protein
MCHMVSIEFETISFVSDGCIQGRIVGGNKDASFYIYVNKSFAFCRDKWTVGNVEQPEE